MLKAIVAALFGATLFTGVAAAQSNCASYPYPNALSDGTTADGGQVYANFTAIQNCANYSLAPLANPHFTGSVGIGTGSPTALLQLNDGVTIGNSYGSTSELANFTGSSGNASYLKTRLFRQTAGTNWIGVALRLQAGVDSTDMGYIDFNPGLASEGIAFGNSGTELMRITSAGNVGIGTTSPTSLLQLYDSTTIGNSYGNTSELGNFSGSSGNTSYLKTRLFRQAGGTGWTGVAVRLQSGVDSTDMGYIDFNPGVASEGIAFGNSGTEFMRITSSGNVGIGTPSPVSVLQVHEATNQNITFFPNGGGWSGATGIQSVNDANGAFEPLGFVASQFFFDASTGVGINTTSLSGYTLLVAGPAGGTTNWTNISDARLKKNVAEISDALGLVKRLRGVRYDWRPAGEREVGKDLNLPTDEKQIGFIAQEVAAVVPEAVVPPKTEVKYRDKGGKETTVKLSDSVYGLKEAALVPVLVEAIKEQQAAIEKQQSEIETLKGEVAALKSDKPSTR